LIKKSHFGGFYCIRTR